MSPWIGVVVGLLIIAGRSLVSLLPAVIFVLRSKETVIALSLLFGYAFVVVIGAITITAVVVGSAPPAEALVMTLIWSGAFAATLAAPLLVMRATGYRLVWPRDRRTTANSSATAAPTAV